MHENRPARFRASEFCQRGPVKVDLTRVALLHFLGRTLIGLEFDQNHLTPARITRSKMPLTQLSPSRTSKARSRQSLALGAGG